MEALRLLSASTDLTLTHEQGQIRISGHSTGDGLLVQADSPAVLKAAIQTMKASGLKPLRLRSILKELRDSPQVIEIRVENRTLLAIEADRVRVHYVRILPYLPSLL